MSGFTKLHSSLLTSTIWREDPATKVVWVTFLAMADIDGIVEASIPGLAAVANVSLEEVEAAVAKFLAPDRYSRTPDNEGRRIETIDGGWRLLNYDKYREKSSIEELRVKATKRQQRHRERVGNAKSVTGRDKASPKRDSDVLSCVSRQAEAEAEIQHHADFDGSEWALKTFKAYPTWGDPDATIAPLRLLDAYMQTIEAEAPSHGGLMQTAQWFFEVTLEHARQSAGKEKQFIMGLEKFLRQGYAEVKMPRPAAKYVPRESDEDCEKRLRAESRQRRSVTQEAIAG